MVMILVVVNDQNTLHQILDSKDPKQRWRQKQPKGQGLFHNWLQENLKAWTSDKNCEGQFLGEGKNWVWTLISQTPKSWIRACHPFVFSET